MNAQEAAVLCRFVKAVCPQQAIDEHTPDTWGLLLANVRLEDAKLAVVAITQRSPFCAPAEIIQEVKRIRGKRIAEAEVSVPPPGLNVLQTTQWLRQEKRRLGDGLPASTYGELKARHLPDMRAIGSGGAA